MNFTKTVRTVCLLLLGVVTSSGYGQTFTNDTPLASYYIDLSHYNSFQTPVLSASRTYCFRASGRGGVGPLDRGEAMADAAFYPSFRPLAAATADPANTWEWVGHTSFRPTPDVFNPDHIYYFYFQGSNTFETLIFQDNPYSDNVGGFNVDLFEVSQTQQLSQGAVAFNGANSYGTMSQSFLSGATVANFTIEFWVKNKRPEIDQQLGAKTEFWKEWGVGFGAGGKISFMHAWPNTYYSMTTTNGVMKDNQWQHVAIVGQGTLGSIYVDGTLVHQQNSLRGQISFNAAPSGSAIAGFTLGFRDNTTLPDDLWFLGDLSDFRVWDTALSASQVTSLYSTQPTTNAVGLRHWIPFNEGSGSTFKDIIGGLQGQLFNTAWTNRSSSVSQTATIRVPQDKPTIQAAVTAANKGDTVLISDGTYNEHGIVLTKSLTLRAVNGNAVTTVNGQNLGGIFQINLPITDKVIIQGLTITGGTVTGSWATVRRIAGMLEVRDCIFMQNYANGGVIDARGGADYSILEKNKTLVIDCVFHGNNAENVSGVLGVTAVRCLFYNNTGWNNALQITSSDATNCVVYGNSGGYYGGGVDTVNAVNCIIWGNGSPLRAINMDNITYSIVQGGYAGIGNLNSDPFFVNAANGDFHLQTKSPAIDAGDPSILDADGSRSDMGAFGGNYAPSTNTFLKGLVAYYPFNGNANDESGSGKNGTVSGASPTKDRFGVSNSAYAFNGGQSIDFPVTGNQKPLTFSVWFNTSIPTLPGSYGQAIVASSLFGHWGHDIMIQPTNNLHIGYHDSLVIAPSSIAPNNWYHVVVIWSSTIAVYVNGSKVSEIDYPDMPLDGSTIVRVGDTQEWPYRRFFSGSIDDLRIYNRALSAQEVSGLHVYESTAQQTNSAPKLTVAATAVIPEMQPWTLQATAIDADIPAQKLVFSLETAPAGMTIDSATGLIQWTPTEAQGPGNYMVIVKVTDDGQPAQTSQQSVQITVNEVNAVPFSDGLVAYYPFNGNANDESGNGNNGTVHNVILLQDRFGRSNHCYSFDPHNKSYIDTDTFHGDVDVKTISWWQRMANPENFRLQDGTFEQSKFVPFSGFIDDMNHWDFYFNYSGYNVVTATFEWFDNNGYAGALGAYGTSDIFVSFNKVSEWTHFILVIDSDITARFYRNGNTVPLEYWQRDGFPHINSKFSNFKLGIRSFPGQSMGEGFPGELDDIRIYNRSLSPSESQAIYAYESTPTITLQPTNVIAALSTTVSMNIAATNGNNATLSFQWFKDNNKLAWATYSSLVLSNLQPANVGDYYAVVGNGFMSVTSSIANVSVPGVNQALWKGLVAYYPFNGNANDASNVGNNNPIEQHATFIADRFGSTASAIQLNGINDYIKYAFDGLPNGQGAKTLSLWVSVDKQTHTVVDSEIIGFGGIGNGGMFGFFVDPNGYLKFLGYFSDLMVLKIDSVPTQWIHLVAAYTGSQLTVWANGQQLNSALMSLNTQSNSFQIGRWLGIPDNSYFKGSVDDIRIYNCALSSQEVRDLFAYESTPTITLQPTSVVAALSTTVSMNIAATNGNNATLSFQWFKDNNKLAWATNSSLVLSNLQPVNVGDYYAVVGNGFMSVTSSIANVSVPGVNQALWKGLVAYYPFNGNANDESGNVDDGVVYGAKLVADRFGNASRAYYFNAANMSAIMTSGRNVPSNSAARTFSLWFRSEPKYPSETFITSSIFDHGNVSVPGGWFGISLVYQMMPDVVTFLLQTGSDSWSIWKSGWDFSKWHQMVWVVPATNSQTRLYIDGLKQPLDGSPSPTAGLNTISNVLWLGYGVGRYFDGALDDVRIYNRALAEAEVLQLYASEAPNSSGPPLIVVQPQDQTIPLGRDGFFTVAVNGQQPLGYQWRIDGRDLAGATNDLIRLANVQRSNDGFYSVVASNAQGSVTSSVARLNVLVAVDGGSLPTNGLVGYYPFNGNANDESGLGDHGQITLASMAVDRFGIPNRAFYFDSALNAKITTLGKSIPTGSSKAKSFSCWFKLSRQSNGGALWSAGLSGEGNGLTATIYHVNENESALQVALWASSYHKYFSKDVLHETWHQFVVVVEQNSQVAAYLDGQLFAFQYSAPPGTVLNIMAAPFVIGHWPNTTRYFNGFIDDVRIYNKALSFQEVENLYAYEAPVPQVTEPVLAWANPADIVFGTALSSTQLNASADVNGTFAYSPANGVVLKAGSGQTLSVTFTPTDTTNYSTATTTVSLNVLKAAPVLAWTPPVDIVYGAALSSVQLNASADVNGTFAYSPASGTILKAGSGQTLSVTFTPTDTANYSTATKTVSVNVLKAVPVLTWSSPADIVYGTALNATQLNASADVNGTFVYSPASGTILKAGQGQVLSVTFTPTDTANYSTATKAVSVNVLKAPPVLVAISDHTVVLGEEMVITLEGHQVDLLPNQLTYWLVNGPTNATVSTDGHLRWTPVIAQSPSTNSFRVGVSDGSLSATNAFSVEVIDLVTLVNGVAVFNKVNSLPPVTVSIRNGSRPDWLVFYSLDGTTPTDSSYYYVESFTLEQSSTVWPVLYSPDFSQWIVGLPVRVNVLKAQTLDISVDGGLIYQGPSVAVNATASSGLPVSLEVIGGPGRLEGNNLVPTGGGMVAVRATQAGDEVWGAVSVTNTFTVSPAAQTIRWTAVSEQTYGAGPVTLNATASSELPVNFQVASGPGTVSGNQLTLTGAGTIVVKALQPGTADFQPTTSDINVLVAKASQTLSFAAISSQAYTTSPIPLAANASSKLTVSFEVLVGPATVNESQLTLTGVGTVLVRAMQAGDANFNAATPKDQTFTVSKGAQTITFTPVGAKTFNDPTVTLNAISSAELPLTFQVISGPGVVNGNNLSLIGAGSVVVQAAQAGNDFYSPATAIQTVVVGKAAQTLTFGALANIGYTTNAIALVGTASSTLPVTFRMVSGPATVAGNNLTLTGVGTVAVAAEQTGDTNYLAAASATNTFTVSRGAQTIAFTTIGDQVLGNPPIRLQASSSANLAVVFTVLSGPATLSGSQLTLVNEGTVVVRALNPGSSLYLAAQAEQTFSIRKMTTLTVTVAGGVGGTVTMDPLKDLYVPTDTVTLSALPVNGFEFTGWSGDLSGSQNPATLAMASSRRVTATFRDAKAPVITIVEPVSGSTQNEQTTLRGTVTDNVGVTSARWHRDGDAKNALVLGSDGSFQVGGLVLSRGVNVFEVIASDAAGNSSTQRVEATWAPSRTLYVINPPEVQEGKRVTVPILLTSQGDVGGMSFAVKYDTNYLREPELTWSGDASASLNQVNYDAMGLIRANFALPVTGVSAGTSQVAQVTFRARSVPFELDTVIELEVNDVSLPSGEQVAYGTDTQAGRVHILKRRFTGDNNANDRLDIGDATIIQRLIAGLEESRTWDVSLNDLNASGIMDSGDVIKVLRTVVGIDAQPTPKMVGLSSVPVIKLMSIGRHLLVLAKPADEAAVLSPPVVAGTVGQMVTIQVVLTNTVGSLSGASFALDYPTNAIRLLNVQSHRAGALVPLSGAIVVWNVAPSQTDYAQQSGRISFAASSANAWATNQGVLAEFAFQVQAGAAIQSSWPIVLSKVEVTGNGFEVRTLPDALASFGKQAASLPPEFVDGSSDYSNTGFSFMIEGQPGDRYRIETSATLTSWSILTTVTNINGSVQYTDPSATTQTKRFYRAVVTP